MILIKDIAMILGIFTGLIVLIVIFFFMVYIIGTATINFLFWLYDRILDFF